jgi:hypothetical protein
MSNVPALVSEFRAIMADPMGSPSEAHMRAYVEHVSSTIPQGGHFYGVWCVEDGKRTLCEFDGCVSYEAYTTAHEAQAEAARLCQQYGAGCYVSAPVPAGLACYNRVSNRIEVATGNDAAVRFHMDGGYIVVTLADCSTADQAIAAIESGLVASGAIEAPEIITGCGQFRAGLGAIVSDWQNTREAAVAQFYAMRAEREAPAMVPQQVQQQQAKARPSRGTVEIFVFERDDSYWWNLSRADAGRRGPFTSEGDAAIAAARAHPRNACSYRYLCAPSVRTLAHHAKAESCYVETRTLAGDVVRRHGPFPRESRQFSDAYHSEMSAGLGHNRSRRHDDPSCQRVYIVTDAAR